MAVRADDVDFLRDRSLVELCQAGDEGAFGDLYSRYYQRLFRFCLRRVGNAHEAEEITQEAFARAFTALPRFAGERRFYPWLTVIASRLCIDSHRRVARSEPTADVDPGHVDGGQQAIIDDVDYRYLALAMEQLGPRHREVLELREKDGWTYQQIADHYSVTLGTVEALLFRARKALKREFLAIAGPEARLAGVPLLGGIWRLAHNLRARMHDLSSHAAPIAAASAMSVAAVAGGLGLAAGGGHAAAAPAKPKPVATVVSTVEQVTEPVVLDEKVEAVVGPTVETVEEVTDPVTGVALGGKGTGEVGRTRATEDRSGLQLTGVGGLTTDAAPVDQLVVNSPLKK